MKVPASHSCQSLTLMHSLDVSNCGLIAYETYLKKPSGHHWSTTVSQRRQRHGIIQKLLEYLKIRCMPPPLVIRTGPTCSHTQSLSQRLVNSFGRKFALYVMLKQSEFPGIFACINRQYFNMAFLIVCDTDIHVQPLNAAHATALWHVSKNTEKPAALYGKYPWKRQ